MSAPITTKYTHTSDNSGSFFLKAKIGMRLGLEQEQGEQRWEEKGKEETGYWVDFFFLIFPSE